ncbi:neuronal acetylcholine receptor subunit alpha-10-like isoform X1 [Schistocerca piceifrons]|uniref:neuronal acetylcholine receptor subunit alpha-10-like isoform X1 n=1 Tax=Schistocerca piceifrons TaxID=274613 RepID=UPI001F5F2AD8|nr:neuronal acetylcholine receptor subunit alpha-10-like isoform X1 [Schistocerca piceifrons]
MYSDVLLFFLLVGILKEKVNANLQYGCQTEFTDTYAYKNFHPVDEIATYANNAMIINFSVRASSDAHILLSPTSSLTFTTPVYEIVLGAGQNSFSVIRGKQRRRTMNHTRTPSILSATEERGFWIRLTNSLIEIGKGGGDERILYAADPLPLHVQYVCFSTWYQVTGKWIYGCPTNRGYQQEEEQLTVTQKLRKDMLTYYDPYSRPTVAEDQITTVYIDLQCLNVKLDEKKSIFTVNGVMRMKWNDEKMRWNPLAYNNVSLLYFTNREIWQPDIILVNAAGHGSGQFGETRVLAKSDGSVSWSSPVHLESWCSSDLNNWPKEQHTCELTLTFASKSQLLQMMTDNSTMGTDQSTGSEWNIISHMVESALVSVPGSTDPLSGIIIQITIKRDNESYKTLFVGPFIACILMTLVSFWLPPDGQYKILCSCCGMIILSKFIIEFGNLLPTPAYNVPPILFAYCSGLIAMALSLFISTLVICLTRYKFRCALPRKVCYILSNKYLHGILFLPPIMNTEDYSYATLDELGSNNKETSPEETKNTEQIQQYWTILATVIDRISCFTYAVYLSILLATNSP